MITARDGRARDLARLALAFVAALGLLSVLAAPALAQDVEEPETPVVEADTELVVDSVRRDRETGTVTAEVVVPVDLAGEPLPGDAVTVIVGNRRQEITYAPIPGDTIEVVLVVDVSGSMAGTPLASAKAAASSFVGLLPDGVQVAVVAFDDEVTVASPLTQASDPGVVAAIDALAVGGDTALFDALIVATEQFSNDADSRRIVLALTDGGDSASASSLDDARDVLAKQGAQPHAVALATSESATETLEALVRGLDGQVQRADGADALVPLYNDLAARLANRFTVSFTPSGDDSGSALMLLNANGILAGAELPYGRAAVTRPGAADSTSVGSRTVTGVDGAAIERTPLTPQQIVAPTGLRGWMATDAARVAGIGAIAVTLFLIGLLVSLPSEQMTALAQRGRATASSAQVSNLTGQLEHAADRFLGRKGRARRLSSALERAGIAMRPGEFVVVAGCAALGLAMVMFLRFGVFGALVAFVAAFFLARLTVSFLARRRANRFVDQLPSTLQLIAGALRAGYALPQAVEHVANETDAPTADEFHRLSTEVRLGRDLSDSLHAMDDRLRVEDFSWVVHAIDIHRQVGGDLAEVLDKVHSTMLDRNFVRRQVSALSAEGRYSAYLITSLPIVVCLLLAFTNPDYIGRLVDDVRGYLAVAMAGTLILIGSLWMRALAKVKF